MPDTATVLVPSEYKAERLNAATPGIPSVEFAYVNPWRLVFVRTARSYLQGLLAMIPMIPIGVTTGVLTLTESWQYVAVALGTPVLPAVTALIQNTLEVLNGWDETKPELRG